MMISTEMIGVLKNWKLQLDRELWLFQLIQIDQDPLGKQAYKIIDNGHLEVWRKELADNK